MSFSDYDGYSSADSDGHYGGGISWDDDSSDGDEEENMPVDEIRYTHKSISREFKNGSHSGTLLEDTFRDLVKDPSLVDDIPAIKVMAYHHQYWAVDGNRRLFVFKALAQYGIITDIPVCVIGYGAGRFHKAHTTNTNGSSVKVRGIPKLQLQQILQDIYDEYR